MALALDLSSIDEETSSLISKTCTVKPAKSQYNESPELIFCFDLDELSKVVYIPLGCWRSFINEGDLPYGDFKRKHLLCYKDLYTLETDPKGYRDQNVVFEEALGILKRERVVFLALSTGFGKTTLGNYFTCHFGLKTVVLCHIDKVNDQWVDEYMKNSNAKVQRVKGDKPLNPEVDVYVIGIQKAAKMHRDCFTEIGLVIIDEAHIATITAFSKALLKFQPRYVIGLSATPKRADGLHKLLTMYFGPKKQFIHRQEVKDFTVYKVQTPYKPKVSYAMVNGKYVPNWTEIINSIEYNTERHDLIVSIIMKHPEHRILVLSNRREQARSIYQKAIEAGENDIELLIDKSKKGGESKRVLVAGSKKVGTGFDDPTLTMLIIASDCKSVEQWEGRIRTTNNIIYDLVDDYKTFENHWAIRESWYLQRGAVVEIVNYRPAIQTGGTPNRRLLKSKSLSFIEKSDFI